MDVIIRAVFIYLFLLLIFRITGNRSLARITPFDFILLLIVGEATQQALLGNDYSLTNAALVITSLVVLHIAFSLIKQRSPKVEQWLEGTPIIILENGQPIKKRMDKERIDESDILESARQTQGLERLDQIKYAIFEKGGSITVIPKSSK